MKKHLGNRPRAVMESLEMRRHLDAAPLTLQGLQIDFTALGSTGTMAAGGVYTFQPSATNQSTFSITGTNGIANSNGSYFYAPTSDSSATLTTSDPGAAYNTNKLVFDASGRSGTYTLSGNTGTQTGTFAITPQRAASIQGVVFQDLNGSYGRDVGEQGQMLSQVYVDLNQNQQFDAGEPSSLTSATGHFSIVGITPGQYTVRQVVPGGMRGTLGVNGIPVTVPSGATVANINFGLTTRALISGRVYNDLNTSNSYNPNEPGVRAVKVYLDMNRNGIWDYGENFTTSNPQGLYFLNAPPTGNYDVRVASDDNYIGVSNLPHNVTTTVAASIYGRNFGVSTILPASFQMLSDDDAPAVLPASLLTGNPPLI